MTDPKPTPTPEQQNPPDPPASSSEDTSTKLGFFGRIKQTLKKPELVHPSEEAEIVIMPEDESD